MKAIILRLLNKIISEAYKVEYTLQSRLVYCIHWLSGGRPQTRIIKCHYIKSTGQSARESTKNKACIFAAYHDSEKAPASNINYISSLHACGFKVFYVHNGQLTHQAIDSLTPFCEQIISRSNIGQDFGAWKDGYIYCMENHLLTHTEWLLLCNDSNFFLGGGHATTFITTLNRELSSTKSDLIALNKNYECWQHYQSYFLCFHSRIFTKKAFNKFWEQYLPLNNRFHAIKKGEIALTRNIIGSASASILFDSPKLHQAITECNSPAEDILQYLPKDSLSNLQIAGEQLSQPINKVYLHQILAYLDYHNPGHAYALLWVKFLKSPFLKKDLYRQGVFSLPQIISMLNNEDIDDESKILEEILHGYTSEGSSSSYIYYPREACRKGIPLPPTQIFHGYGYKLVNDTTIKPNGNA
jgi:hypothetical protein